MAAIQLLVFTALRAISGTLFAQQDTGYDTVDYEFTIEAPLTYTDKITAIVPMTKLGGQIYEYACHEGNYGMVNILRGARVEEQLAQEEGR